MERAPYAMPSCRPTAPLLRRFVSMLWATGEPASPDRGARREHVLPTGAMHLVFRLSGPPLRLFRDARDDAGYTLGYAIVGGARSTFYARDVSVPGRSVGAQLLPGASMALFGVPAQALAERHTPLDVLWGRAATASALERLHAARAPAQQLAVLQTLLDAKLRSAQGLHPAVAQALGHIDDAVDIGDIVRRSGYSHRRLIALFRESTGLAPKTYARVVRFQRALASLDPQPDQPARPIAELALDAGYSDQAHFGREFVALAGMTPQTWRRAGPRHANHVPVVSR